MEHSAISAIAASWFPLAASFLLGLLVWPAVEYLIHGVLSHRYRTFVSPLHWGHHKEPRAVFTSPYAWVPIALLLCAVAVASAGVPLGLAFMGGLLLGFLRYERLHWRIHFREPRNARERRRRDHHLAHHYVNPRQYHGVTTRLWDRIGGSLPESWPEDYARVAERAPLAGPSNLAFLYGPGGWRILFASASASAGARPAANEDTATGAPGPQSSHEP